MIPPSALGLSAAKFPRWRKDQPEAITAISQAPTKYVGIVAPTGFGKSLMILGHALKTRERTCILTSTKALSDQYLSDFADHILDIRGQSNYDCEIALVSVADAPCHGGFRCELRDSGCYHFDLKRAAATAPLVSTNYQFWLHSMKETVGLGLFDRVILDESHNVLGELSKFLSTRISSRESRTHLSSSPGKDWVTWASGQNMWLTSRLAAVKKSKLPKAERYREIAAIRALKRKLGLLARADSDGWIMSEGGYRGEWNWECIHPGRYASKLLFQRAEKFLLTSASIRPRTFQDLYISPAKITFREYPSTFPISRRPIYYYGAIAYSAESTEHEINYLVAMMDQWIGARLDRKGIIHSVSYERAGMFKRLSKHGHLMIVHGKDEISGAVAAFKRAKAPRILVSPSITEGHSFAYRDAEYVIVPKIPFADTRTEIHRARVKTDRTYGMLETAVAVRQMFGRAMRAEDDQCEGLILDKQFEWLHRSFRRLFPPDFNESIKHLRYLPASPPRLVAPKISGK